MRPDLCPGKRSDVPRQNQPDEKGRIGAQRRRDPRGAQRPSSRPRVLRGPARARTRGPALRRRSGRRPGPARQARPGDRQAPLPRAGVAGTAVLLDSDFTFVRHFVTRDGAPVRLGEPPQVSPGSALVSGAALRPSRPEARPRPTSCAQRPGSTAGAARSPAGDPASLRRWAAPPTSCSGTP